MVVPLLIAIGLAVLAGGAATFWLWGVQRQRLERAEGLTLLSAMRWREFSKIVVDGLRARGFEPETAEDAAERGQDSVIHLRRDGREWLLACKQGVNYRVTPVVIGDVTDAVRFHGADGGVVATPGTADSDARRLATGRVELVDGEELWPLVRLQLAASVREELSNKSRKVVMRQSVLAWVAALALGLFVGMMMPRAPAQVDPQVDATGPTPTAPRVAGQDAPLVAAPATEEERRTEVTRMVGTLPGVERAMWSTRSTLMVFLVDENADPVNGICSVLKKYEDLRTSRLHLQPPTGSSRPARFLQCATF
ncbi:restriction endonuclease [Agrilutibacter solisilvae]|uniref:Restriction endonuclease n=1 Tax=Agrilutibacter solisilvae TaxID=2763317 RepID=A0A974XXV7_9GAMM|nr:restriction endonuclease [Lysobacter solisilvae]QSX77792.1 restriction endonuclease [Lysobacter solisilvae]